MKSNDKISVEIKQHKQIMFALTLFTMISLASIGVISYLLLFPKPQVFINVITDDDGRVLYSKSGRPLMRPMAPQEKPVTTRATLLQWATLAVTSINNFTASNYQTSLKEEIPKYFTPEGGQAFLDELESSGILDRVVQDRLILSSVVIGTPVVLKQGMLSYGIFNNKYTWKIQLPLLVTFQAATRQKTIIEKKKYIVTLLVIEMPTWLSPNGIGIQQYTVTKA